MDHVVADELEDHWYILRRREMKNRLSNVFGGFEFGQDLRPPHSPPKVLLFKAEGTDVLLLASST